MTTDVSTTFCGARIQFSILCFPLLPSLWSSAISTSSSTSLSARFPIPCCECNSMKETSKFIVNCLMIRNASVFMFPYLRTFQFPIHRKSNNRNYLWNKNRSNDKFYKFIWRSAEIKKKKIYSFVLITRRSCVGKIKWLRRRHWFIVFLYYYFLVWFEERIKCSTQKVIIGR